LRSIKGVGSKTIADLERVFDSEEDLVLALRNDVVPLRDDVVEKLKRYYRESI